MNIAVCLKVVPDLEVAEIVNPATGTLDESFIVKKLDTGSIAALEMALRFKQKHDAILTAVVIGSHDCDFYLKEVYAQGVDLICRVWHENIELTDVYGKALVITTLLDEIKPLIVFCGNRSSDTGHAQLAAHMAELLDYAQITGVSTDIEYDGNHLLAYRRLGHGARELVQVELPAVAAVEMEVGGVTYSGLDQYLSSYNKRIRVMDIHEIGLSEEEISGWHTKNRLVSIRQPNPASQAIFTPDSGLDPIDRIRAIVSGGLEQKTGMAVEGSPEELAEKAFQFLLQRGFL